MENFCRDYLLAVATAFGKAQKISLETVSRRFHGNVYFLSEFADGKISITLRKFDEMLASFAEVWPKGVAWPKASIKMRQAKNRR